MFIFLCAGEQAARSFIGQNRQQTSCLTVYNPLPPNWI